MNSILSKQECPAFVVCLRNVMKYHAVCEFSFIYTRVSGSVREFSFIYARVSGFCGFYQKSSLTFLHSWHIVVPSLIECVVEITAIYSTFLIGESQRIVASARYPKFFRT